jgi:hypothetical protein
MTLKGSDSIKLLAWFKDLTYQEVHLFVLGMYSGLVAIRPKRRAVPRGPGLGKEGGPDTWYHRGGYILGYIIKVLALAWLKVWNLVPSL